MATQKDRTADDLGASPRSSGSRSTLQSSAKKRKDLRSDRSRARAQAAAMREVRVPETEAAMILYNGTGGVSVPFDKQPFHHDGYWSLGDGVAWGAILHPVKPKSPYKRGSIVSVNGKFHARVVSSEMELAGDRYGRDDKWTWRLCISALGARRKPTKEAVPASRRTGAKRSPKGTGRGSAKATPK